MAHQGNHPGDATPGASQPPMTQTDAASPARAMMWLVDAPTAPNPSMPACEPVPPGMMLAQYELIRELGRGGMGAVYLARDTRLSRRVAVKLLANRDDGVLAERFFSEARVTARCKHDNIVDIYDIGEAQGYSYMVLEYLEGITLRTWLTERWRPSDRAAGAGVSPTLAAMLMAPVVRALSHAHGVGLVHRDLKPENIMLTDNGAIKVLDFGIAKQLSHEAASGAASQALGETWTDRGFETRCGAIVGTMPYMAPEQWGAGDIDARTDIWAVGIILWELCAGRHPLEPLSRERLMSVLDLGLPMPSMREHRPDLGPLAGIIDRCLQKDKNGRIPSAKALLDELEALLPSRGAPSLRASGESYCRFRRRSAVERGGRRHVRRG